jgi:serine/threonine-protein kinase HipA
MSPTRADVVLWGTRIGAVVLPDGAGTATFAYDPDFVPSAIQVAPLTMPLRIDPYTFRALPFESFHGLPGLLADALPDRYGNALIDAWLARQGRQPGSFNAVERLCYVGTRGMGALEFAPTLGPERGEQSTPIQVDALVELASEVLSDRTRLSASFAGEGRDDAMRDILRVGTSAGGARAKAVIAWNPATEEVRSGQASVPAGFEHWLLKFDGVTNNRDRELADPQGFGLVEYAYSKLAARAGIEMEPCRLLSENGRHHFMTRRFDRVAGDKLHMQSLAALQHYDFHDAAGYSYEQALLTIRLLGLPTAAAEQQFRRMVFNVVARNQDDHVKNIAFLMDRRGRWSLSPAFDVTWSYNPQGDWTSRHQMSLNGKRDNFTFADFQAVADGASLRRNAAREIHAEVRDAVAAWPEVAAEVGVPEAMSARIAQTHRLALAPG